MLFKNIKFLILPNLNASSTQFRAKLLENNGGTIIDSLGEIDKNTIVLIVDSFVNDNEDGITEFSLFEKESIYDLDAVYDNVVEQQLACYRISTVSKWLSSKIVPQDDNKDRIKFANEHKESDIVDVDVMGSTPPENIALTSDEERTTDDEVSDFTVGHDTILQSDTKEGSTELFLGENEKYVSFDGGASDNKLLIDILKTLSKKYKVKGDTFRARGYDLAKSSIEKCNFRITSGEQAQKELANIGPSIGSKIQTILDTGTLPGVEVVSNMEQTLSYFQNCHGVGPFTAKRWAILKMDSFYDILTKMPEEFVSEWPSLYGWEYYEDWSKRILRRESEAHLNKVMQYLHRLDPKCSVEIHGSYNRGKDSSGDIDLLFYKEGCDNMDEISSILQELVIRLYTDGYIKCILQLNPTLYDIYEDNVKDVFKRCN